MVLCQKIHQGRCNDFLGNLFGVDVICATLHSSLQLCYFGLSPRVCVRRCGVAVWLLAALSCRMPFDLRPGWGPMMTPQGSAALTWFPV